MVPFDILSTPEETVGARHQDEEIADHEIHRTLSTHETRFGQSNTWVAHLNIGGHTSHKSRNWDQECNMDYAHYCAEQAH